MKQKIEIIRMTFIVPFRVRSAEKRLCLVEKSSYPDENLNAVRE